MNKKEYILIDVICEQYPVANNFIYEVCDSGLVELTIIEQSNYIHENEVSRLEKIIRLNQDLDINLAGIEVVMNLLQRIEELESELSSTKRRLTIWQK